MKVGDTLVKCDFCDSERTLNRYRVNRSKLHFCNRKCRGEWQSQFMKDNKFAVKEIHVDNKQYLKKWYQKNKSRVLDKQRKYYADNRSDRLEYGRKYDKNIRRNKEDWRLVNRLRSRLISAMKLSGGEKALTTFDLIGCDLKILKKHLQQTAINNGYLDFDINDYNGIEYHIDHIIPICNFNILNEDEQKKCFHYKNLQILTASENLKKHKR